jgi:hypothetical protein
MSLLDSDAQHLIRYAELLGLVIVCSNHVICELVNVRIDVQCCILCNRLSVPIPSVSTSASSYGAFMGLSGNLRYQLLFGAERLMQDHFEHLGVVIFFSAALRYVLCRA